MPDVLLSSEVSLFGPGFGESVVLCLRPDCWVVVDCCVHPNRNDPLPLEYLRSRNVDLDNSVKLIVVSHWHDDHIRGVSKLVKACPKARVVFSDAIRKERKEFLTLVCALSQGSMMESTGLSEMDALLATLETRQGILRQPLWAIQDRLLLTLSGACPIEVRALSPSDYAVLSSKLSLGTYIKELQPKRRLPDIGANEASVAMWVSVGNSHLLLGADQESSNDSRRGWSCILAECNIFPKKAFLVKLPHHGAASGDDDRMWDELLSPEPIAIMTPFVRGKHRIPTDNDCKRILAHTSKAYITERPSMIAGKRRRDSAVTRTIKEVTRSIRTVPFSTGQVRVRFDPDDPSTAAVDLLDGAIILSNV